MSLATLFFADFCSAQIWPFRYDGSTITEFTDRTAELAPGGGLAITSIVAFGEGGDGEMYIVDRGSGTNGEVYRVRLNPSDAPPVPDGLVRISLAPPVPNPFTALMELMLVLDRASRIDAEIVDASGRVVRILASGELAAGRHPLAWDGTADDGRRAASGVYFVRARRNGGGTQVENPAGPVMDSANMSGALDGAG